MREEVESFGEEVEVILRTGEEVRCGGEMPEESLKSEGAR